MTGGRDIDGDPDRGAIYRRLGVEPIVNGRSTFTILGGSLMPPVVLEAMRQAAESFVDLVELETAVGRRIAELTHNEAAFVSGGAAAGLFLAAVTAMARDTADGVYELDDLERYPRDFVIAHAHRVPYDLAVRLAGGRLVPVGDAAGATRGQVEDALTDSVAAVIHVLKGDVAAEFASLRDVTRLARERGIPVIVDAAAQLPPVENLWRFGENGADVTLFSGGKGLCGPASTGLVLGASVFVERISRNASPLHRIGRPMKVGKEDLVGILTAVEWFVGQDHVAVAARYRDAVAHIVDWGRGRADVEVMAEATGEAGQPTPRARIRVGPASPLSRDALAVSLRATPPRIDLLLDGEDLLYVAPETLVPGEERLITRKLDALLGAGSSAQPAAGAVD